MFLRNEPITGPRARFHSQAALLSQLWWGHHGAGAEREGLSASLCLPWAADPSLPRPTASHDALSVPQTSQAGSHSRTSDFLCPFRVGHSLTTEKPWPAYLHPPHTLKTLAHVPQFYFLIAAYKYLVHCPPHPTGRELLQNQGASVLLRLHPAPAACLVSSALSKHVT